MTAHDPRRWGLYLVTDRHQTAGRDLVHVLKEAVAGGVSAVQLRERDLSTIDLYRLAERILDITNSAGATLIINDRLDLAMALPAGGVQLTRNSLPPGKVRDLAGPEMLIGISCHRVEEVQEAAVSGADFVVLGPIYATPSKARYGVPLSPAIIQEARSVCPLPILAIGGIKSAMVPEVIRAGADGVAAISAVLSASDPGAAAREMIDAVVRAKHSTI